jgi:hypothetical protein
LGWRQVNLIRALDPKTLEVLAEIICGDEQDLKYRKGWELPLFFRNAGLRCPDHDGSTRKWWALDRLREYSQQPGAIEKILLRLASPKEYDNQETFHNVIRKLNQRLALEGYEVVISGVEPLLRPVPPRFNLPSKETIAGYPLPDFSVLVDEQQIQTILQNRWEEAKKCFQAGAYLATIIALGSLLEGLLLAKVKLQPAEANRASSSPKDNKTGKVKQFHEWTLADYINVAHECGWIQRDVRDFSEHLRNYRNMVHPWHQQLLGLAPDEDTCKICWEVVNAAVNDLTRFKRSSI